MTSCQKPAARLQAALHDVTRHVAQPKIVVAAYPRRVANRSRMSKFSDVAASTPFPARHTRLFNPSVAALRAGPRD